MASICSSARDGELNGNTWCPLSRQRVTITSTIAGSSSMMMILAIVAARRVVAALRKATAGTRILDRKSTRLNSSHVRISYAVFCLKKKKKKKEIQEHTEA